MRPYYEAVSPPRLARLVRLRHRGAGRHGHPQHGPGVLRPRPRRAVGRRGRRRATLKPESYPLWTDPPVRIRRQGRPAGGDAHLVRRRQDAAEARATSPRAPSSPTTASTSSATRGRCVCGGWSGPPTLYPESRRKEFQTPPPTIPRSIGHRPEWIKACKDHKPEDAKAGFAYSGPFTEALLVGNLALRLQKRIEWDAATHEGSERPRGRRADPQALSRGVRHRDLT